MKQFVKRAIAALGVEITRQHAPSIHERVVSLTPQGASIGNVLLAFIIEPFLRAPHEPISNAHSHDWESVQMAQTFLDMGYSVDVISYLNRGFAPDRHYSVFVGARTNFERIARLLNSDCIRVVHLDTAHWIYNNHAAYTRLRHVQQRRNVALGSIRVIEQNWAIEHAHCATTLGNDFTADTYRYAGKPVLQVPVSVPAIYDWPIDKDFDNCRRHFLWFGSAGFVHKGLDLVLEAFADMPELRLTICGPIDDDPAFKAVYERELYRTPNIHTHGWIDVESDAFLRIARDCVALVYPSCAEGGGSSVLTCMHAGVVPVVTREASVDIGDFGVILNAATVDEIKAAARHVAALPPDECHRMARGAWDLARRTHTREIFAATYRDVMQSLIASCGR